MIWDILKFPNFEYYPAGCAILEYSAAFEYGPAFLVWPSQFEGHSDVQNLAAPYSHYVPLCNLDRVILMFIPKEASPASNWLGHTQKAALYSSMARPAG